MVPNDHRWTVIRAERHRADAWARAAALIAYGASLAPSAGADERGERRPQFHCQAADNRPLVIVRFTTRAVGHGRTDRSGSAARHEQDRGRRSRSSPIPVFAGGHVLPIRADHRRAGSSARTLRSGTALVKQKGPG